MIKTLCPTCGTNSHCAKCDLQARDTAPDADFAIHGWQHHAFEIVLGQAARQRDDETLRGALNELACNAAEEITHGFSRCAYEQLLHLDALSSRLQGLALPRLPASVSARQRAFLMNATRFALEALRHIGVVTDATVIAAAKDSTARLYLATMGQWRTLTSGRLDLAARRRFDIPRDASLRPLIVPLRPVPSAHGETADLRFLADEAEYDWIRMVPTNDRRIPRMPRFAVSHRDARLLTQWSAAALDSRLARGGRWDAALDAARIERTGADRSAVVFDPYLFMVWWTSLAN